MSKDILFIVEDDRSVNSRAIGNIDWARANGFIDLKKVKMIVNKVRKRELTYVNITEIKLPVIYKVPFIKNLNSFENSKMLRHAENILSILYPSIFYKEKRGFLFFRKKQKVQIPAETPNAEEVLEETTALPVTENMPNIDVIKIGYESEINTELKDEKHRVIERTEIKEEKEKITEEREITEERGDVYPMKVYVNTGYKELDEVFKSRFKPADSLADCDAAIISYISNKEYIKNLLSAGKRIILLAGHSDYRLMETAREIGIKDIYSSPIDPKEIINNLLNEKGEEDKMLIKKEEIELKKEEPVVLHYSTDQEKQPEISEMAQKECEEPKNIEELEAKDEINIVLDEIKNILAKNKEIYESRISMQEKMIKQMEEAITKKEEEIKELRKAIDEYRKKEEEKKKIILELQKLLQ
ncbi:hypothetical protein [Thermoanaerobacter thermocopriae]|nr:hypothetical protein [Thermoanaerobacter thermocopriae]